MSTASAAISSVRNPRARSRRVRRIQIGRGSLDAPRLLRPDRRMDGEPARRPARRRAVQVFRRLDRPRRQGRAAEVQAAAAARASSATSSSRRGSGATEKHFVHDLISSDRRYPTVNAYGPLYGSHEYSTDDMPILDPKTHKVTFFKMPVADPNAPESFGPPAPCHGRR